jgi:hypothetical protein
MTANPSIFVKVLQHEHGFAVVVAVIIAIGKIIYNFFIGPARTAEKRIHNRPELNPNGEHARSWFGWPAGWAGHVWGRRIRRHDFGTWRT